MIIVPAYTAIFAALFIFLSTRTIKARRSARVAIGTGGDKALERASRVHANFAEYVPSALLLIAFTEMRGLPSVMIHLLCLALLSGRVVHAWGVSRDVENFRFRITGMMLTLNTMAAAALCIVASYFI